MYIRKIIVLIIITMISSIAYADIIYENGTLANVSSGHNPMSQGITIVAVDFDIASQANIGSFTYNAFNTATTVPPTNIDVYIYENLAGQIGSTLYANSFIDYTVNDTGLDIGQYDLVDYTVNINNLILDAGNYFVGLHVDPDQFNMHWSIDYTIQSVSYSSVDNGATWTTSNGRPYYFRFETASVPEPSAVALMGLGIFGLVAIRRKFPK